MNTKALKFNEYIKENLPNVFRIEEDSNNELHPVIYSAIMDVDKKDLDFWLVIDDSFIVYFQARLANSIVNKKNRIVVLEHLNSLNETYKTFKYYIDEQGSIIIESCLLATDEEFNPGLVHGSINAVLTHLQEEYKNIMKIVWSN